MSMRHIVVKKSEIERLRKLMESGRKFLQQRDLAHLQRLEEQLDEAEMVRDDQVPPGVITINSKVRVKDLDAEREQVYTLVFPLEADIAKGRISILAPIGAALLGGQLGEIVEPRVPHGVRRLKVQEIVHEYAKAAKQHDAESVLQSMSAKSIVVGWVCDRPGTLVACGRGVAPQR